MFGKGIVEWDVDAGFDGDDVAFYQAVIGSAKIL
jgi:hypothetical protein